MKALSWLELQELRNEIAGLDIPEEHLDELILLMDAIVVSWIDQAFGLSAVQLSLSARANYAFAGAEHHAMVHKNNEYQPVDSKKESAINALGANRHSDP